MSPTLWMPTQTWQTCRGGRKARNHVSGGYGCLGQTSSGGRRAEAHERHGQGMDKDAPTIAFHSNDGQGSRNLCDDETLSTISHSDLTDPSGEGSPKMRGCPCGRRARRSTPRVRVGGRLAHR